MIDLQDLDIDLKNLGLDERMRLAFTVMAKHVNAALRDSHETAVRREKAVQLRLPGID